METEPGVPSVFAVNVGFISDKAAPKRDLLLTLNDLPDKSSIGSKMIASAGSASVPVHRSYMAEGGAPPAPIGGFPIASCRLKKLASQA